MKKVLLISLSIFLSSVGFTQHKTSSKLQSDLSKYPNQNIEILVIGTERIDAFQYEILNRNKFNTKHSFEVSFLKALKANAEKEQLWLHELRTQGLEYKIIHSFWSMNLVAISAPAKTIAYLEKHPEVYWMEEISEKPVLWHKPVEMRFNKNRVANGKETGISAVKGDSLWGLGYTGNGSKLLTFDTGIWPNHPSFRDQFLGHHVPLKESWYGYDTYFPGDKTNSHGSHVTGTCLGLNPLNSDTIGLAFNAYFMATDPIVQSLADVKTVFELMMAYEWAMNPDGDLNTTDDMPDVINNSWGRPFSIGDSVICDGWVGDFFVNIEVAGIVSIHSAGNAGPGVQTIGYPAVSNVSVVNNFSIGAVNGNVSSFPIASFSSRGPSICGGTGSLLIKPEIVAPGVSVRSSVREADGTYSFANYQGTSMSAPHVSGISLLLVEAFPLATATEIKEAMYYSAIDLGVVGEDNTYGNGMLDGMASYRYLANLYTPAIPQNGNYDIHLTGFDVVNYQSYCDLKDITAYYQNTTDVPSSLVSFEFGVVGKAPVVLVPTSGSFMATDSIVLGFESFLENGWNEVYVKTSYFGALNETDTINNTRYVRIWINENQSLPFLENFDSTHVFESKMFVGNPDQRRTWDTLTVPGITRTSNSAVMNLERYSPRNYQHDFLQTPNLEIIPTADLKLSFDLSYQLKFNGFKDSLIVMVSTDCGNTWGSPVYTKGPDDLNTTSKPKQNNWIPLESTDWRTEIVDLSAYKNESTIMIRIETANGQGNNLYLDNINVFDDRGVVSVKEINDANFVMFPNPVTNGILNFNHPISGQILAISGMQLITFVNQTEVDVSGLTKGVYLVLNSESNEVQKLIVN